MGLVYSDDVKHVRSYVASWSPKVADLILEDVHREELLAAGILGILSPSKSRWIERLQKSGVCA